MAELAVKLLERLRRGEISVRKFFQELEEIPTTDLKTLTAILQKATEERKPEKATARKQRDGVWTIDAEGKTVFASERMAEILGTSVPEMLNHDSFAYVFPEDVEAAQRLFGAKKRGNIDPFRFRLRRKDGSAVWVKVQGTPMHDESGVFRGIIGTFSVSRSAAHTG